MFDGKAFGAEIVGAVKAHLEETLAPVMKRLEALEARSLERGEKGDPGRDGADGRDADPVTIEQIRAAVLAMPDAINDAVAAHIAANPPAAGKDGADGKDGKDGRDGADGKDGCAHDGADGVGLAGALIDRAGNLVVTLTDGTTRELGPVVGKDGRDGDAGVAGRDGFGFDDLELVDTDVGVCLRFARGDEVKDFRLPIVTDRGIFQDGKAYDRGDGVTYAGSFWIAQEKTQDKPDSGKGWRLAVKRGRDGKSAPAAASERKEPVRVGVPTKAV